MNPSSTLADFGFSGVDVPAGHVFITYEETKEYAFEDKPVVFSVRQVAFHVPAFQISQAPVNNAQYQLFVDADDGYANPDWWNFSPGALKQRQSQSEAVAPETSGDHQIRTDVTWYDCGAYCRWLSSRTGIEIRLPTEAQWLAAFGGEHINPVFRLTSNWEWCGGDLGSVTAEDKRPQRKLHERREKDMLSRWPDLRFRLAWNGDLPQQTGIGGLTSKLFSKKPLEPLR
jgi:formylglycine-generating enzyme required for sulfatase activity